jgi:hypothetical protein
LGYAIIRDTKNQKSFITLTPDVAEELRDEKLVGLVLNVGRSANNKPLEIEVVKDQVTSQTPLPVVDLDGFLCTLLDATKELLQSAKRAEIKTSEGPPWTQKEILPGPWKKQA